MTSFRWLVSLAFGLTCLAAPAIAVAFDVQAAKKTCLENYNAEKDAGTIPAGMPKAKYISQCANSMRRSAELERQLATAQTTPAPAASAGNNEITATTAARPAISTSSKPSNVSTPAFAPPRGY